MADNPYSKFFSSGWFNFNPPPQNPNPNPQNSKTTNSVPFFLHHHPSSSSSSPYPPSPPTREALPLLSLSPTRHYQDDEDQRERYPTKDSIGSRPLLRF
ncbi:hypothetical protein V6N13_137274 [Hibiscus sabdariffa]|uniref:Uncharacterized protein n=1 Tax=Hibiscus sabdariffa TaxID=183260 RepID=A0ABR2DL61_9ROSI